jgi:putative oligomerization/nucleic acid binding protein/phospholipase D-like protein
MVMAASSGYPLMDVFWTMFIFFAWMIWLWLLITIFMDLFSRHDVGGWGKAGWTAFVLVTPFLGVFIYLITQSKAMAERKLAQAQASQESFDAYVKSVATTTGGTSEISRAKELLDSGAIDQDEYDTLKRKALAG